MRVILTMDNNIIVKFILSTRYGLKLVRVSGSVREGLKTLKEMPNVDIQAIFVGSRATDPHCGTHSIQRL